MIWRTTIRALAMDRPLVMAILNVTPDSFSDGGKFFDIDAALRQVESFVKQGADILDIGGESTRPGSIHVPAEDEIARVRPVIEAVRKRFDVPISVDTSKSDVARAALDAGAEIVNDISGLRFDENVAAVVAAAGSGLVLMHSRGQFESMHSQAPVENIMAEVISELRRAVAIADRYGVADECIALDIGIGFGKSAEQNLELIAKLDRLISEFPQYPFLVGTSRKSFIGRILDGVPVDERLSGSLATAAIATWQGAKIIRAHDVKATVETLKVIEALREQL